MKVFEINAIANTLEREAKEHNKIVIEKALTKEKLIFKKNPLVKEYQKKLHEVEVIQKKLNDKYKTSRFCNTSLPDYTINSILRSYILNKLTVIPTDKNVLKDMITIAAIGTDVNILETLRNKLGLNPLK